MPDRRPGPLSALSRSLNRAFRRGPAEVLGLLKDRTTENWHSEQRLFLYLRDTGPLERPGEGLTFRRAEQPDATRYAQDIGTDSASSFVRRLADDVMCFVVESEGMLLHSSWVTTTAAWTREIRGYLSPPPGDAYVYESFTRADARGRGIYPFALAGIVTYLGGLGVRRVWVGVEETNVASQRAIEKAEFRRSFELRYTRRMGRFRMNVEALEDLSDVKFFLRENRASSSS